MNITLIIMGAVIIVLSIAKGILELKSLRALEEKYKQILKCTGAFIKDEKTQPDTIVKKQKQCDCDRTRKTCRNCKGWY